MDLMLSMKGEKSLKQLGSTNRNDGGVTNTGMEKTEKSSG